VAASGRDPKVCASLAMRDSPGAQTGHKRHPAAAVNSFSVADRVMVIPSFRKLLRAG
jgi:hypothetical protein